MKKPNQLQRGVITSSSMRDLSDFLSEVQSLSGEDVAFDLFLLRDTDILEIERDERLHPPLTTLIDDRPLAEILAEEDNRKIIYRWLCKQFAKAPGARISAFATYFPDISSPYEDQRNLAVRAIVNTIRLANELHTELPETAPIATSAVVELVAGSILEPCRCAECQSEGTIFEFDRDEKMDWIVESLRRVIAELENAGIDAAASGIGLAFEVEPGDTYVLNDLPAINLFFEKIDQDPVLSRVVGLNLDIAHMRIVPVFALPRKGTKVRTIFENKTYTGVIDEQPEIGCESFEVKILEGPYQQMTKRIARDDCMPYFLDRHWRRLMHSHVSDHPGMHTRDQPVGKWTCVFRPDGGYADYIRLLFKRAHADTDLPFSWTVALELEGCNRMGWVAQGLVAIKQAISMAAQENPGK